MNKNSKIYVAGHRGLVGSAIVRNLKEKGYTNIIGRTHSELDLMSQQAVISFFEEEKPEYVVLAAAKVGGIGANSIYPADFIYENMQMQNNIIKAAHDYKVTKLLFLGSSCIYPKNCPQPIKEEYLLSGYLEPTNEGYALAKIAGLKMCQFFKKQYGDNFISCMPTNLYGPNDNFDLNNSHVMPALIRKFHEAKVNNEASVEVWGTGKPLREFLYVDDMADACVFLLENYEGEEHVNVGTGKELTIGEMAEMIKKVVGFTGELRFNTEKPDGTMRKLLDVSKLYGLGWSYKVDLEEGIEKAYAWFEENYK
ncbi:GDP-L-fucose synthase [Clostridium algoriphilum]|uniref:GDP-L-fucose synthase family protein n=1 Tax=Clostridium algoriphilum TaxID=198347 RepID=UPI001CF5EFA7|nr:GDP-L-fucose synthase [Clostridium algoriphilum]MCB2293956.1 GDP-L-fucose synthase [Clostridium algoriphilum]